MIRRPLFPLGLLLPALALLAACGAPAPERVQPLPPGAFHIAIVVLDACRADKFSCYGLPRPTTPEVDALARDPDAVLFRRHYVQGAWTKPSTASLFTGLFVFQHMVTVGDEPLENATGERRYLTQKLGPEHVTLAERMGAAGFTTFGVVKSHHLVPENGFDQGFDTYIDASETDTDADRVGRYLELARQAASTGKPFFSYMHLGGCHHPFEEQARDPEYMRQYGFPYDEAARKAQGADFTTSKIKARIDDGQQTLEPEDVRFLNLVYEAELRRVDRTLVRPLLDGLRASGLYDQTLLIITADHGEELYEHQGYAHSHALWEEVIHVPLVVKFPRGMRPEKLGHEVTAPTRAIDIGPALLAFAGQPAPRGLPGVPIFHGVFPPAAFAEINNDRAWIEGPLKFVSHKGQPLLFDLAHDPHESHDLSAQEPGEFQVLLARADELRKSGGAVRPPPLVETTLDEEAEKALRSLGYIR